VAFDPDEFIQAKQPAGHPVSPVELQSFDPDHFIKQGTIALHGALQEKYGSTLQTILAGIEGAARGGTLGLSDVLATKSGITSPQDILGRMQANPSTSFLSNVAGTTAAIALTGGLAAPAQGAARALTLGGLGGIGPLTEAATTGSKLAQLIGEGALISGGNVVSDYALGDPTLNAEKILTHIGVGAAIGGGLGLLSKSLGALPAFLRGGKKTKIPTIAPGQVSPQQALEEVGLGRTVPGLTPAEEITAQGPPGATHFRASLPIEALAEADQKELIQGLSDLKPNAPEILAAGKKLGAPVLEGIITADEHLQKLDYNLTQSPSPQGIARNRMYQDAYNKAATSVSNALGAGSDLSLAEAGDRAKILLSDAIEARYAPIQALYAEIEGLIGDIPIAKTTPAQKAIRNIIDDMGLVEGTPEYSFVNTFANGLEKVNDLKKLQKFSTAVDRATGPETRYVSKLVKEAIHGLNESSVDGFIEKVGNYGPLFEHAKEQISGLLDQIKEAKGRYKTFRQEIGKIAKVLFGGAKIYGPQDFLNKIENQTSENFAGRLFSKDNSRALEFMNQEFPEVTRLLSDFEKSKIRKQASPKNVFTPSTFFRNLEKMSPELKQIMFNPEEQEMFQAGKLYFDNFLKNFNPSGTAGANAYHTWLKSPSSMAMNWVKDFGIAQYIKRGVRLTPEEMGMIEQEADKAVQLKGIFGIAKNVSNKIEEAAKAIAEKGHIPTMAAATYMSDHKYEEVTDRIKDYHQNPQKLLDDISENTQGLYQSAPHITQALSSSLMNAIGFLHSKIPPSIQTMPLSPPVGPSQIQKSTFANYYHAVNDPLMALNLIRNGRLNNQTMEALMAVHPALLKEMQSKVIEFLNLDDMKKMSYPTKLALAKFLNQPLDENMIPMAIVSNQAAMQSPQLSQQTSAAQAAKGKPKKSSVSGLSKLKLSERAGTRTERNDD
jgi:hypothetical protein